MQRDWKDFKSLNSNISGAREAFEDACEILIRKMFPKINVKRIRVKLGDGGIDIYVGELGIEPISVYQCKFFLDEISSSQKSQIRKSFTTAITSKKIELSDWTLCLPKEMDIDEAKWWTLWKDKQIKKYKKDSSFINYKNGNELIDLMKQYKIYDQIFKIEELTLARDTNTKITQLVKGFNPKESDLPTIRWSTYIGKQTWKNTPVIIGNDIFIGSAGIEQNNFDEQNGVYCINTNDGKIKWAYQSKSDVNEVSFYDGVIVAGCDNGDLICLSGRLGTLKWSINLGVGITSKIFKHNQWETDIFIVITYDGVINLVNVANGKVENKVYTGKKVMGNVFYDQSQIYKKLFIPTIEGELLEYIENSFSFEFVKSYKVLYPDYYSTEPSQSTLYSTPIVEYPFIYVGFVRQTYYDYPAIVCFNMENGEVEWFASDPKKIGSHFGNVRTGLINVNNEIIFTHPYSNELIGLDKLSGEVKWITKIGRPMFNQWSSPLLHSESVYLPRFDGYIYRIDLSNHEKVWGMYLGEEEDSGVVYVKNQKQSNENESAAWELFKGHSIYASPAVHNDNLIIGSYEGYLYYIENP